MPPRLITQEDLKTANFYLLADDWAERRGIGAQTGGKANAAALGIDPAANNMGAAPPGNILTPNGTAIQWFTQLSAETAAVKTATTTPATPTTAGLMSGADKTKLNGIETGATKNDADSALRDRRTHTGTQPISSIDGLDARIAGLESGGASLNSPAFTGTPTAPTAPTSTSNNQLATTAFVKAVIQSLIETTLGNDPQFAATITNLLAAKAPLTSPLFTGNPRVPTAAAGDISTTAASTAFVINALTAGLLTKLNLSGGVMTGGITFHSSQEFPKDRISAALSYATVLKYQ